MLEILLGAIGLVGLGIAVLWLIGLAEVDDKEEVAGLVTANWDEIQRRIDDR
jgi:hypothetical protein